jgi:hypothetical protein
MQTARRFSQWAAFFFLIMAKKGKTQPSRVGLIGAAIIIAAKTFAHYFSSFSSYISRNSGQSIVRTVATWTEDPNRYPCRTGKIQQLSLNFLCTV